MSCGLSREMLALHVEGDLPDAATATAIRHLASCEECRRFLEELRASQARLKSMCRETVSPLDCTAMRREVMTIINERPQALGWMFRFERAIALGLRPSYGIAAVALLAVLSASVLAQMRRGEEAGALLRPDGYRGWILVAGAGTDAAGNASTAGSRVYINPSSYREYVKTRRFPDGTVLVWEQAAPGHAAAGDGPHATSSTLLVSFKDSARFEGGWGFFDFSSAGGEVASKARALPESRGCRMCHRQRGENDHVFTQRYSGLRG